jgi:hypothetical protein
METGGWAHPGEQPTERVPTAPTAAPPPAPAAAVPGAPVPPVPPVPLRPLTTADVLDGSFTVITRRPRTVLAVAAVVVVPVQLLGAWATRSALPSSELFTGVFGSSLGDTSTIGAGEVIASFAVVVVENLALFLLGGALAALIGAWYTGSDLSAGAAVKASLARGGALVGAWALLLPVKVVAAIPDYLGLLFVTPVFALTAPAIVLERLGPFAGAKRSWTLVLRRFFPVAGVVLLVTLVDYVLGQVLAVPGTIVAAFLPSSVSWVPIGVAAAAASLVTQTALVSAAVLLYLDLRVRTEGLDLELSVDDAFRAPTT